MRKSGGWSLRDSSAWTEQQKLLASDAATDDWFGSSMSLSGDTALVSAPGDDDSGSGSGSAYVFVLKKTDGEPCTQPSECVSTLCVDSVCCDTDCGGDDPNDCQACSVATGAADDGVCGPVSDGTACAEGTCQGGVCEPSGAGGSGTGGSGGTGTGGMTTPPGAEPVDEGGCGCRLEATRSASPRWDALGLLGLGLVFARRRKRQTGRPM